MTSGLSELLTPSGMALLDSLPPYSERDSMKLGERMRKEGHSPELVAAALTQSRLRAKAVEKFGPFAERMLFTQHGLEQSTRLAIAAHHAARFRDAGIERVADLGCGLGGDTIAKAGLGLTVIGVDLDPETVACATVNTSIFENASIEHGAAEDFNLSRVDGAWFDPARREDAGGRGARVHDPEAASPPLSAIVRAARELGEHGVAGAVGAKMAPAIDHANLPPGTETQWVSWRGHVLEACLYFGPLARTDETGRLISRSALVFPAAHATPAEDGTTQGQGGVGRPLHVLPDSDDDHALRTPELGDIDDVLLEPDGAIIRAGLLGTFAREAGAHIIDESIAYLAAPSWDSSNARITQLARAYRVREVLPFSTKKIAAALKARGVGTVEIKKRGADIDPAVLRKQLKLEKKASGQATVIITRARGERVAIIADPLR